MMIGKTGAVMSVMYEYTAPGPLEIRRDAKLFSVREGSGGTTLTRHEQQEALITCNQIKHHLLSEAILY
jgi:hypothetical protein